MATSSQCKTSPLLCAWAFAITTSPAIAGGILTIMRVGDGAGCTHATLASAISGASTGVADLTEIRLSKLVSDQVLTISDRNIRISGNWSNCTESSPSSGPQTIGGNNLDTVIRVNTTGLTTRSFELNRVVLRGGGGDNPLTERGGGLRISGRVDATVNRSLIFDNESTLGGGIAIDSAFATLRVNDSVIGISIPTGRNIADGGLGGGLGLGGGIYCRDSNVTLQNTRVTNGMAKDHGGGIYADNCLVRISADQAAIDASPDLISDNSALGGNGGGIYATGNSTITWRPLTGSGFAGATLNNRASLRGGAVFLTGSSSFIGDWIRVESSQADERGGAFALEDESNLTLRGGPSFACNDNRCPGIFSSRGITQGNSATLIGGAIYAEGGSVVDLRQQQIFDNFANNGSALHLSGSTTQAELQSVLIARNVLYGVGNGTSTIELTSSADATLRFVTMSGNSRVSNMFPGIERAVSSIRANGGTSLLQVRNSLLWNDANESVRLLVGATVFASCTLSHENATLPSATVANPLYVDTTGDNPNFALSAASPAIDRCAGSGDNEDDIYGRARPVDQPLVPNVSGAFDAGAIEFISEAVFADGFEYGL